MPLLFITGFFDFVLLWNIPTILAQAVITVDNCTCKDTSDGGIYSLWPLCRTDGKPRFKDIPGNKYPNWLYAYNPCTPFDFGKLQSQDENYCKEVAICQYPKLDRPGNYHPIGMQKGFECEKNKDGQIKMFYPTGDSDRSYGPSAVVLLCDLTVSTPVFVPTDQDNYVFSLTHRCACKNQCSREPTTRPPTPASSTIEPSASSTTKGPTNTPAPTMGPTLSSPKSSPNDTYSTTKNTSHGHEWIYLTAGAAIIVTILITVFLLWKCRIGNPGERVRLLNNDVIKNDLNPDNRDANFQNITQNNDTVPEKKKSNNENSTKLAIA